MKEKNNPIKMYNNYLRSVVLNMLQNKAIRISILETAFIFYDIVFTPVSKEIIKTQGSTNCH